VSDCLYFFFQPGIKAIVIGMNIRWDHFVGQYDTARYVTTADARDNRHIQFVREFASVVSVLQVMPFSLTLLLSYDMLDDVIG